VAGEAAAADQWVRLLVGHVLLATSKPPAPSRRYGKRRPLEAAPAYVVDWLPPGQTQPQGVVGKRV
jgi:hypothetical protein